MDTASVYKKAIVPLRYWREILAVAMLLLAIIFFRSERKEIAAIFPALKDANHWWLAAGLIVTTACLAFQSGIYRKSFSSVGLHLPWGAASLLYLKRYFLSVFLPAGGVSALAYMPSKIRKAGYNMIQVHKASGLFGFAGLLSVFIGGVPIVVFALISGKSSYQSWIGLVILLLVISTLFFVVRSLKNKGRFHAWLEQKTPTLIPQLDEVLSGDIRSGEFTQAVLFSVGVELTGILHVYISCKALGLPASFGVAAIAYITSVLLTIVSPFLRGLGAVELAMIYVLHQFGYSASQALSITILYRVFEFWLLLLAGLGAFAWNRGKLFMRLAPALLSFSLGVVNMISAATPPIHQRVSWLKQYLPFNIIHASNLLVLFTGLFLVINAAFLVRGLRNAWIIAVGLSVFSLFGHLFKALDYEEASVAAVTIVSLLLTATQYRIRGSNKWIRTGFAIACINLILVLIVGFISFYFIDQRHFGEDFSWQQSLWHTLKSFLLIQDPSLKPITPFGHEFVWIIRIVGICTWGFLLFTTIKPYFPTTSANKSEFEKARSLVIQYGDSPNDYFKIYKDKLFFFSELYDGFIAYRQAQGFAVVLEEPVCAEENKLSLLKEFEIDCIRTGLKPVYYRVNENSIPWFSILHKSKIVIGQEAIADVQQFSLNGKDRKSIRNGINGLEKKGYTISVVPPPHNPEFVAHLKKISDEWLITFSVKEMIFSQGLFDEQEIQQQHIITLSDNGGAAKAFLNIIPDYTADECTYDLIRKTDDAPAAAMDALIVELFRYAKARNLKFINMGLVPMTGLDKTDSPAEQLMNLASDKIKRFQHYKGLREFKEKYATIWENKYLVYENDFDLLQLPLVLTAIMKP